MFVTCPSAVTVLSFFGSITTISASDPGFRVPFFGQSPYSFAGFSESTRHAHSAEILPFATPSDQIRLPLVSTPASPPGIFVKSSLPSCRCFQLKLQWSVETVSMTPSRMAFHKTSWSCFVRSGGAQTYLAPSKSGSS